MSRIRSTHPGQWTDENFVECSIEARLLLIGLVTIASDEGNFNWSSKSIKMKIFPAESNNIHIPALLSELIENDQIEQLEDSWQVYGCIKNFNRWCEK